jgi:hypothetical protein
MSIGL